MSCSSSSTTTATTTTKCAAARCPCHRWGLQLPARHQHTNSTVLLCKTTNNNSSFCTSHSNYLHHARKPSKQTKSLEKPSHYPKDFPRKKTKTNKPKQTQTPKQPKPSPAPSALPTLFYGPLRPGHKGSLQTRPPPAWSPSPRSDRRARCRCHDKRPAERPRKHLGRSFKAVFGGFGGIHDKKSWRIS